MRRGRPYLRLTLVAGITLLAGAILSVYEWFRHKNEPTKAVELVYHLDTANLSAAAPVAPALVGQVVEVLRRRLDPNGSGQVRCTALPDGTVRVQWPLRPGQPVGDLAEYRRPVEASGVLEFRIAVETRDADMTAAIQAAREQLRTDGPGKIGVPDVAWFEIDPVNGTELTKSSGHVIDAYNGRSHILLYTDAARSFTQATCLWKLTRASVGTDPNTGQFTVYFGFDSAGTLYFGRMTGNNLKKPMAILLGNRALSAPTIQSAISGGSGQITFASNRPAQAVRNEAEDMARLMEAGAMPCNLKTPPVRLQTIDGAVLEPAPAQGLWHALPYVVVLLPTLAMAAVILLIPMGAAKKPGAPPIVPPILSVPS